MLVRFHTFEEASLFVAARRAEGYFAEVIHQNAGHFYGHMAMNGFAVIVSEEAAPEDVVMPDPPTRSVSELAKVFAIFCLVGGMGAVLACLFAVAVLAKEHEETEPSGPQIEFLLFCALLFVCWYGMLKLTRIYNRPEHPYYELARCVINGIAILAALIGAFFLYR